MQTVMVFGAGCCTVLHAAHHFAVAQPSHSDDFRNALERISLDIRSYSVLRF